MTETAETEINWKIIDLENVIISCLHAHKQKRNIKKKNEKKIIYYLSIDVTSNVKIQIDDLNLKHDFLSQHINFIHIN